MSPSPKSGPPFSAGRLRPDGRRLYRLPAPIVIWWLWLVIVVAGLADVAIQGHQWVSPRFGFGLLAVTGLVFACAWWPRVIADETGLTVYNPFRTYRIAWTVVDGVYLGESVEISCRRGDGSKPKTVYCWALASSHRSRAKAEMRAKRGAARRGWGFDPMRQTFGQPSAGRTPDLTRTSTAELIAREVADLAEEHKATAAGDGGASEAATRPDGPVGRWAWQPAVAFGGPAVAFAIVMLTGG